MLNRILSACLVFALALTTLFVDGLNSQARANLQIGGFSQIEGTLKYCNLRTGSHTRANIQRATNGGARPVRASSIGLVLVHMRPMGRGNHHAKAVLNGRRVSVCVPNPNEIVYVNSRNVPIVMHSCGNEVLGYATETKRKAREIYKFAGGEGGDVSSIGGGRTNPTATPSDGHTPVGGTRSNPTATPSANAPAAPAAAPVGGRSNPAAAGSVNR